MPKVKDDADIFVLVRESIKYVPLKIALKVIAEGDFLAEKK